MVQGSCGGTHTMVVTDEGRCFIWGRAAFGRWAKGASQAGVGWLLCTLPAVWSSTGCLVPSPPFAPGHPHHLPTSTSAPHPSSHHRLGTGVDKDCISPVELKLPGGPERWRVIAVAAGGRHSLVLALPDSGNLAQRQLEVGLWWRRWL